MEGIIGEDLRALARCVSGNESSFQRVDEPGGSTLRFVFRGGNGLPEAVKTCREKDSTLINAVGQDERRWFVSVHTPTLFALKRGEDKDLSEAAAELQKVLDDFYRRHNRNDRY